MSTIQEFLKTLQGCFQAPLNIPEENTYLDLSLTKRITAELLTQNKDLLPAQDLIAEGFVWSLRLRTVILPRPS